MTVAPDRQAAVSAPELVFGRTGRGFAFARGIDRYGADWSIQDSSLAEEPCVWLGNDDQRAHLTQPMAVELAPYLNRFIAIGSIAEPAGNPRALANEEGDFDPLISTSDAERVIRDDLPNRLLAIQQCVLLSAFSRDDMVAFIQSQMTSGSADTVLELLRTVTAFAEWAEQLARAATTTGERVLAAAGLVCGVDPA